MAILRLLNIIQVTYRKYFPHIFLTLPETRTKSKHFFQIKIFFFFFCIMKIAFLQSKRNHFTTLHYTLQRGRERGERKVFLFLIASITLLIWLGEYPVDVDLNSLGQRYPNSIHFRKCYRWRYITLKYDQTSTQSFHLWLRTALSLILL